MTHEQSPSAPQSADPKVHILPSVPVYTCHVYVSTAVDSGAVIARTANLPGLETSGRTEREALQSIVRAFKEAVLGYSAAGQPIAWIDPPLAPRADERTRFLPVHL